LTICGRTLSILYPYFKQILQKAFLHSHWIQEFVVAVVVGGGGVPEIEGQGKKKAFLEDDLEEDLA
jgi:carbamate kinase